MKIKSGFMLRRLGDGYAAAAVGERSRSFNGIIRLNSTGAFLWEQLGEEKTASDLAAALAEKYDVSDEQAQRDVAEFEKKLADGGFLE
jgi:hypothetical protein